MKTLVLVLALFQGNVDVKAKAAFDTIQFNNVAKAAFDEVKIGCACQNCDCTVCQCKDGKCDCPNCHSFDAVYAKSVRDNQVIVLAVGTQKPDLGTLPWKIIEVKAITGEKPGYIVGVPKDGSLVRLDFKIGTPKQRIRLDVLHVIYPLTSEYQECPTCPTGRILKQVSSYRNPIGHTHTCTSCGETWDHTANPTHTCKNCGGHPPITRGGGYLADPTPRMVKVTTQARSTVQSTFRTISMATANCPNCPR